MTAILRRLLLSGNANLIAVARNVKQLGMAAAFVFGLGYAVAASSVCHAGGGPENVFLFVNSESPDSLTVANHYIDLQKIPPTNVYYLSFKGSKLQTTGAAFRDRILAPALAEIERRKLTGQIDYLVYSCDFPWRINLTRDFPDAKFPKQLKPQASLTGATYLADFVLKKRKELIGLNTNGYYIEPVRGVTISRAFRSSYQWAWGGRRARRGYSYRLSSILGVTQGRGNTVDEIVRSLRRAKTVSGTKPAGPVYFMKHGGVRSTPRHDRFDATVTELQRLGVQAKVVAGKFPEGKKNLLGLTCGTAFVDMKTAGCSFLPGAFCDNLTSAGANFVVPKQIINPRTGKKRKFQVTVCDFIRYGATGACGAVIEPYNFAQKFPHPSVHVHYANGCSLAEAFYQSVAGPYQQLLVGDPLCQPWADIPVVKAHGISMGKTLRGQVQITPSVHDKKKSIREYELYVDGVRIQHCKPGKTFLLDTTKFRDGHHELRVVAHDATPIGTQGRLIVNVAVKNGRDAIGLSTKQATKQNGISLRSKHVSIHVLATAEAPVELFCNSTKLGSVPTGTGTLRVATAKLGSGPVVLYAQSEGVRSKPLLLKIAR